MKKPVSLVLAFLLTLTLTACGAAPSAPVSEPGTPSTAPLPTETTEPEGTLVIGEGEPVPQLDDVSIYASTTGKSRSLEGLPDYVYSEAGGTYKGDKEGRYGLNTHVFANTDAAAYLSYLKSLESEGWVQYSNNIIEGTNLFATYTKDGGSLYCYYISAKNRTYIVTSPDQNLETRECDNQYDAVCMPLLTQVKLLCEEYHGGMSYLLRLGDGRFIIIDGGYNEADFYHAKQLYAMMEEQNVLDSITIAAWIITHPHRDHLGTAADFLRLYTTRDVTIQQMIFNFPTVADGVEADEDLSRDHPSSLPAFMLALETLWPDMRITVCHTGQEYWFADAKIEFLHTLEDFYPLSILTLSTNKVNGASAVFTVEVGGQKLIFLGDSSLDESADLVKMWGGYLKADIMQAAHHAQRGGTVELYDAIDPTVVMVPMSASSLGNYVLRQAATQWIWKNESGRVEEVIISAFAQRTLELPYIHPEDIDYFSNATIDPWGGVSDIEEY